MSDFLSLYLETLDQNGSDLKKLIFGKPLVIFRKLQDIERGLLKYNKDQVSKDMRFLFVFPDEKERIFHTKGMKFGIDIYFYNKDGKLIHKKLRCPPGVGEIKSNGPCKYAVEKIEDEEK